MVSQKVFFKQPYRILFYVSMIEHLLKLRSEVTQLCLTLCNPMDCSLPGSSVHGIFQARILEWVAMSFSRRSSWPRNRTQVSRIVGRCFTSEPPGKSLGAPNLFISILEMGIIIWIKTGDYLASLTQWTWVGWTLGVGDGQGGLACWGSWGLKESDTTERLNWTEPV